MAEAENSWAAFGTDHTDKVTILAACKTFIELIIPPKPDRHITTTIEIQETADVSEYMDNGDKDRGADTSERDEPEGAGRDDAGTGSIPS